MARIVVVGGGIGGLSGHCCLVVGVTEVRCVSATPRPRRRARRRGRGGGGPVPAGPARAFVPRGLSAGSAGAPARCVRCRAGCGHAAAGHDDVDGRRRRSECRRIAELFIVRARRPVVEAVPSPSRGGGADRAGSGGMPGQRPAGRSDTSTRRSSGDRGRHLERGNHRRCRGCVRRPLGAGRALVPSYRRDRPRRAGGKLRIERATPATSGRSTDDDDRIDTGPTIHRDPGYLLYEVWGADNHTFACEIAVPVADRPLKQLRDEATWMAAAAAMPEWQEWIDPGAFPADHSRCGRDGPTSGTHCGDSSRTIGRSR